MNITTYGIEKESLDGLLIPNPPKEGVWLAS